MLREFRAFILRGNVVDLAVGVAIGAAFTNIVNSIVRGLIDPLVSAASPGSLEDLSFCAGTAVRDGVPMCRVEFSYGMVLSSVLSFVIVAAVVFFFVVKPINHLMQRFKADQPHEQPTRQCPECLSKIPAGARRCAFCSVDLVQGGA
ncbi:MAG TPA: large conductance mechanosensitive channel protein MscL [Actinomycetota bacterium]|nr:large conductance mechanosensitive channel protein MscL [Actinomycetota bacterium]